jgi:hypothetical protein
MLSWLESTPLSMWIDTSAWAYPFLLTAHGLGMAVVVGVTAMVGLRVLGFPSSVPLGAYRGLMPYLVVAFIVNAASGGMLFVSDAIALAANVSFQIKMVSVVIGLVVLWRLHKTVLVPASEADAAAQAAAPGPDGAAALGSAPGGVFLMPASAKPLAIAAILIWWLSVIVSGRLVAYLSAGV